MYNKRKPLTTSFSYMGQNVKKKYFWLFGRGEVNDLTEHILLSIYFIYTCRPQCNKMCIIGYSGEGLCGP